MNRLRIHVSFFLPLVVGRGYISVQGPETGSLFVRNTTSHWIKSAARCRSLTVTAQRTTALRKCLYGRRFKGDCYIRIHDNGLKKEPTCPSDAFPNFYHPRRPYIAQDNILSVVPVIRLTVPTYILLCLNTLLRRWMQNSS